jgi:hypothetical protein
MQAFSAVRGPNSTLQLTIDLDDKSTISTCFLTSDYPLNFISTLYFSICLTVYASFKMDSINRTINSPSVNLIFS